MDRRDFVGCLSVAGAAFAMSGCASLVTHAVAPVDGAVRLRVDQYPDLGKPGGSIRVQPAGFPEPIYILRGADAGGSATYTALSPRCTHRGCTVDVHGANLVCPCHGSTYARSGAVLRGPAEQPLRSYAANVDASGMLVVQLGGSR